MQKKWAKISGAIALLSLGTSSSLHAWKAHDEHWQVSGEFVLMRRTGAPTRSLAKAPFNSCFCRFPTLLSAKQVTRRFEYEPGYRVGASYSPNQSSTFEASYLWIHEWEASKRVTKPGKVSYPFDNPNFTDDYQDADSAKAHYMSHFYSGEANYWWHMTPRYVNYYSFSLLAGLRYIQLREHFRLAYTSGSDTSHYNADTRNYMGGLQVGASLDFNPTSYLTWTLTGKLVGILNRAQQKNFLGDDNDSVILRNFKAQKWAGTFLGDFSFALHYLPVSNLDFYGGYEVMCFNGVALAPTQLRDDTHVRHKVHANSDPHIHGFFAGLTLSF